MGGLLQKMNGPFSKAAGALIIGAAAIIGFITYCVKVPFPSGHTLGFLSPLMGPFLMLGEGIYQKSFDYAALLAVCAACAGTVLSLLAIRKKKRLFSKVLILPAFTAAAAAELLWGHTPAAVSYFLLGAAFVLLVIAAFASRREQLRDLIPPPARRNRMLLLLGVILLGLVFRAYHLDIKPPGHAHHSAETGIFAAQMAHECPWDFTSPTRLCRAAQEAQRIFTDETNVQTSLSKKYPACDGYTVYHFSLDTTGYQLILNWIAFTMWGSHFIIQRALSVVLGVLTLYLIFLLAEDLFGTSAGLMAALFMAICPWHNTHTRYSEVCFAITMFCATLTMLCAVRAIQRRSIGWTLALIFNLGLDFYMYPSTQFAVLVVIAYWLYSMAQNRRHWKSMLIVGLVSLAAVALLSAPMTHIFGPVKKISLINSPVNERVGYSVQSYKGAVVNAVKLVKSLFIEATDRDCWYKKEGAILLWPMGLLFMGGLAWCLPRLLDSRCALLAIWFFIGVFPTIPSPDVLARRITCAAPAIYILAALFACVLLAPLRRLTASISSGARRILAAIAIVLGISPAFAAFYNHTMVYEEWAHSDHRRIAEIVYENIRDYYLYLDYDPHEVIEPVWIYCGKYLEPGEADFPITFFKENELTQKILPSLRTGPEGAMFLVPVTAEGNALIGLLRARYPGGRHETYKLDREYFDHSKGVPLCQSYQIPREWLAKGFIPEAPPAEPTAEPRPTATSGPRTGILAGKHGAGPGEYKEPRGIALDPKGNIYVADFRNYRIQKFNANGKFAAAWGEKGDAPGQFNDPCGVAAEGRKRVYVADTFNHRIQAFDASGKFLFKIESDFFAPRGVCIDGNGRIWITDSGNGVLKIFSRDGEPIKTVGKKGSGKGEFMSLAGISVDRQGDVYVADAGNRRVQIFDKDGNYVSEFPVDGWQPGVFNEPYLDLDAKGDIYLTDPRGDRVLRYSRDGKLLGVLKPMEGDKPLLSFPMGIAVEKKGDLIYVVDCRHHRIHKGSKKDFR